MKTRKFNVIAVASALVLAMGVTTPAVVSAAPFCNGNSSQFEDLCEMIDNWDEDSDGDLIVVEGPAGQDGAQGPKGDKGDPGDGMTAKEKEQITNINNRSITNKNNITRNTSDIRNVNARIDSVMDDIRYLEKDLSAGIAAAMAVGTHQFDVSPNSGPQASIAGGVYNGESAVSLAIGAPINDRAFFNMSFVKDSRTEAGIAAGVTFKLPK